MALIDRDELLRGLREGWFPQSCEYTEAVSIAASLLEAAPVVDAVEVVRCKDCRHSYFVKSCSKYECRKGCGTLKNSTDFCSYGKRREK